MTRAKAQRTPSINKITNSKLEIRNKKEKLKILISKHLKTRGKFSSEGFGFRVFGFDCSVCLGFRASDLGFYLGGAL
jgi:hypothetical protein